MMTPRCCLEMVGRDGRWNRLLVCPVCRCWVKTFTDKDALWRYVAHCRARRRALLLGQHCGLYYVTFVRHAQGPDDGELRARAG